MCMDVIINLNHEKMLILAADACPEGIQAGLYVLVAAVYLLDVVDATGAFCTHRCDKQGDTGTDIRTRHASASKCYLSVVTYNYSTVWVAEYYLCTHVNQFVDKEQSALEHLLVEQH